MQQMALCQRTKFLPWGADALGREWAAQGKENKHQLALYSLKLKNLTGNLVIQGDKRREFNQLWISWFLLSWDRLLRDICMK